MCCHTAVLWVLAHYSEGPLFRRLELGLGLVGLGLGLGIVDLRLVGLWSGGLWLAGLGLQFRPSEYRTFVIVE